MGDNLKQKMMGALAWNTVDRFGQQTMQFIVGIILARLLTPSEYGLISVLLIFNAMSNVLIDGGFGQALIRKQNATPTDFSTIFYFNLIVSILLYIVLFFLSPVIADFFSQKELVLISRIFFLSIIFYAVYFIQYVLVVKRLQYKQMAFINLISIILSGGLSIFLALKDFGVWALVYQQLSFQFLRAIFFPLFIKWKPSLLFSFATIKEFWNFSINLLGTITLNVFFNYIYVIIIGRFFPLQQTGFYSQANKLSETLNSGVHQILQNSTYPLLVQIQDERERFIRVFRKLSNTVSLLFFPMITVLIAVSQPMIIILISDKWLPSVSYFQLLLLSNIFTPLYTININSLNARGESGLTFKLEILKKVLISISIIICFVSGIAAMLIGLVFVNALAYFVSMFFVKKTLNHYYKHQFKDILPNLVFASLLGTLVYLIGYLPYGYIQLFIFQILISVILYIFAFRVFQKTLYNKAVDFIYRKLKYNDTIH
jgi:teichuronic acid exporter